MGNSVHVIGTIKDNLVESHTTGSEKFYAFNIGILRSSGYEDVVNTIISERFLMDNSLSAGDSVEIRGQYRSFSKIDDEGDRKLQLFIFVKNIIKLDEALENVNEVELEGSIAKCYKCRHTKTNRDVIDFTFKASRNYDRYDYLTCIAWGRNAMYVEKICGDEGKCDSAMKLDGRIQSREYTKVFEDGTSEVRTVYELSVNNISVVDDGPEE